MKNKWILGALASVTILQSAVAFGQYITPGNRPGRYPDVPPPAPIRNEPRPGTAFFESGVQVNSITRQPGGDWYRVLVQNSIRLENVNIEVQSANVKIHEASVITESRRRVQIFIYQYANILYPGMRISSENLRGENIIAIDIRAESYGGYANLNVSAVSMDARPLLAVENNNQPVPPVQPRPPVYPPNNNSVSLKGYCADQDHQQFYAAKEFAYSASGLNYTSSAATEWALQYNNSHRCGTIAEYQSRFAALYDVAYSGSGLNYTSSAARDYALNKVENVSSSMARTLADTLSAVREFAYSPSGLNYTSSAAGQLAAKWIDRDCEDRSTVQRISDRFQQEYSFAYSPSGLNYTSSAARQYAANKVAGMTRCGDLLRQ